MRDKPVLVEAVSVEVTREPASRPAATTESPPRSAGKRPEPAARVPMFAGGGWAEVDLHERGRLEPGHAITGPAIITEELATTVVEPGWRALVTERGDLLLERVTARPDRADAGTEADPVLLEIFNNLFMSVAEQMGVRLQSTAHSVNIKERLDFSCAVFDADGGLIANAPHMPVHLGSMGESIKMVIERNRGRIRRGQAYVLNDPYHGGTHLPDITVVTPGVQRHRGRHLVLRRLAGPPRRDRGSVPGLDAGRQHPGRGGGGADRQLAAGRGRPAPGGRDDASCWQPPSTRPATRPPTWPTCAPRSPPTPRASRSCARWWRTSGSTSCGPTWATCRRTRPSRCGG